MNLRKNVQGVVGSFFSSFLGNNEKKEFQFCTNFTPKIQMTVNSKKKNQISYQIDEACY